MAGRQDENETTLVHNGRAALTYKEMAAFVRETESRPVARLTADLEGLMGLPDAKYPLVDMVLRKRACPGSAERDSILGRLRELQAGAADPVVRTRAAALVAKLLE